ncbi:hypothetical protein LCGC14_1753260 [marine sediment metagenome]|uniref:Transposase IS200-like domain-containing protein n=1 Tax=marine sediment metagenome TaxID=412755 RepID=A0A0F9HQL6_9ZZZZ
MKYWNVKVELRLGNDHHHIHYVSSPNESVEDIERMNGRIVERVKEYLEEQDDEQKDG